VSHDTYVRPFWRTEKSARTQTPDSVEFCASVFL
jgi:hypothetical protein